MTEFEEIHRHRDGSIDLDFYRARAAALRTKAKRNALRPKRLSKAVVTVLTAMATTAIAKTASDSI